MSIYYTVYQTTNLINGRTYIGVHRTPDPNDNYLGSGKALLTAVKKYGKENFRKEVLAICETEQEMFELERKLVSEEVTQDRSNYNIAPGGQEGKVISEEQKADIRKTLKEYFKDNRNHAFTDKNHKSSSKDKMSKWHSGKVLSQETKQRMSDSRKGMLMLDRRKPVSVNGVIYESVADAAKKLNVNYITAKWRVKNQKKGWRYLTEEEVPDRLKSAYSCSVDGVTFRTMKDAALAHGIEPATARGRFKSSNFPNWVKGT